MTSLEYFSLQEVEAHLLNDVLACAMRVFPTPIERKHSSTPGSASHNADDSSEPIPPPANRRLPGNDNVTVGANARATLVNGSTWLHDSTIPWASCTPARPCEYSPQPFKWKCYSSCSAATPTRYRGVTQDVFPGMHSLVEKRKRYWPRSDVTTHVGLRTPRRDGNPLLDRAATSRGTEPRDLDGGPTFCERRSRILFGRCY